MEPENTHSVMLDPSLLLAPRSLIALLGSLEVPSGETVFVAQNFLNAVEGESVDPRVVRRFAPAGHGGLRLGDEVSGRYGYLREFLSQSQVRGYHPSTRDMTVAAEGGALNVVDGLYATQPGIIADILFEEWVFLQTNSWIASRTKWTFNQFVRAGGVAVEAGRRSYDEALSRAGHAIPRLLTRQGAKRGARWIATTSAGWFVKQQVPAGDLLLALIGTAAGLAVGKATNAATQRMFVLIDP